MDTETVERMQNDNIEQFNTLVRMHLSFELDLNTDDNELAVCEKSKFKKRFNFHIRPKGCTSNSKTNSACSMTNYPKTLSNEGITKIRQLIDFLMNEQNVIQEGIFRRTGSVARQNDLKLQINQNIISLFDKNYSVHDCASVLKGILAELPEPLLTDMYFPAHCQIADLYKSILSNAGGIRESRLLNSLQLLILLLPKPNYILLKDIIVMLNKTIKFEKSNKMCADSLATLFTPHIICPRKLTPEALHTVSQAMSGVVSFMITKGTLIFDIPPKLATDIRAYFVEQRRKQTMSPDQILDESVTSDSTANTVYTFIDREKTAQAHDSNSTDTALAQLYAHIQSLPESSKKRKLIKQFNKENGQGTPLQFQISHRIKTASKINNNTNNVSNNNDNNNNNNNNENNIGIKPGKSLTDSIKKHIFQRGLGCSKTPKNVQTNKSLNQTPQSLSAKTTTDTYQTPNNRRNVNMNIKSRVLFQSPLYNINRSPTNFSKSTVTSEILTTASYQSATKHLTGINSYNINTNRNDKLFSNPSENKSTDVVDSGGLIVQLQNDNYVYNDTSDDDKVIINDLDLTSHDQCFMMRKSFCKSESYLHNLLPNQNSGISISEKIPIKMKLRRRAISLINLSLPKLSFHKTLLKKTLSLPQSKLTVTKNDTIDTPVKFNKTLSVGIANNNNNNNIKRKSISPITKSTQKMSKSMQESIMTPRSRRPVMFSNTLLGSSDQKSYRSSFTSVHEEVIEENVCYFNSIDANGISKTLSSSSSPSSSSSSSSSSSLLLVKSKSENDLFIDPTINYDVQRTKSSSMEQLSGRFREYLCNRNVLMTSPVDSSFSSQPDDFGSNSDIQNISETEMSESLLYCLNGNQPADMSCNEEMFSPPLTINLPKITDDIQQTDSNINIIRKRHHAFNDLNLIINDEGEIYPKKCSIINDSNNDDDKSSILTGETSL